MKAWMSASGRVAAGNRTHRQVAVDALEHVVALFDGPPEIAHAPMAMDRRLFALAFLARRSFQASRAGDDGRATKKCRAANRPANTSAMARARFLAARSKQGYNVPQGHRRYLPVDVHIPGCPPRPEALIHAFMTLQRR